MSNSPTQVPQPKARAEREYSSAFLLACAAFWVLAGTMSYLWGSSLAAGLIMISLAIVFGIGAIARSTKDQPTTKDTAAPPPTNSPRMSLILVGLILVHCVVAVVICRHWLPMIDTYTFQRDACKNLLQGIDPFGAT
ncbi:MAG: hypothetical protein WBX02_05685, partial [Terriglobales bacterium]